MKANPTATGADSGDRRRKVAIAVGVVICALLLYSVWANLRPEANSASFPEGTFWICKSCNNHWNMSIHELAQHHKEHYGEPVSCPKCKSTETIRAVRCPKCGEYSPMVQDKQPNCPKCGYEFKEATPG